MKEGVQVTRVERWQSILRMYLRTCLWTGGVVAIVSMVAYSVEFGTSVGLRHGLVIGLLFGLFMSVVPGSLHIVLARREGQHDPNQVNHELCIVVPFHFEVVQARCESALSTLRTRVRVCSRDADRITAKTGCSWRSFGERIEMRVVRQGGERTEVCVSSRPRLRTTLMDYGKNYSNVQHIVTALRKVVHQES